MAKCNLKVNSPNVQYSDDYINVYYNYNTTKVQKQGDVVNVSQISFPLFYLSHDDYHLTTTKVHPHVYKMYHFRQCP